ncbi:MULTISPECIES: ABC transporter substrate-binding protein [Chelativorans]|jgi:polar amino acid transport system substrate-binding protein|uniref:Amino acid ABC transporter substrate-binding protein, PAAT family n=1 Tax=Chelativorans sp. (strain BNC1) TaxID=266779 RepID=Q11DK4_CHESB|nr:MULTISPECIES: ABC transporter substrate-binding protein [Chelativorans]
MTNRKTSTACLVALAASLLAVSSASANDISKCPLSGEKGTVSITPANPGVITVETALPNPAWWNGDTPDQIADGFEYCLAANIAHRAGFDAVNIVVSSFPALIANNNQNKDLAMATISITEERKKVMSFSAPYFSSDIGVLVKAGGNLDAAGLKAGRIGVLQGTTGAAYVTDRIQPAEVKVYPENPAMFAALMAGQIDAAINDTSIILAQASKSNGVLEVLGQYETGEQYGAIYPKDSPNKEAIDKIIEDMRADGTLAKLASTYLTGIWGADPTKIPYLKP